MSLRHPVLAKCEKWALGKCHENKSLLSVVGSAQTFEKCVRVCSCVCVWVLLGKCEKSHSRKVMRIRHCTQTFEKCVCVCSCVCVRMCVCVCVSLKKCHENSHWTQSLAARRPPRSVCVCVCVSVCVCYSKYSSCVRGEDSQNTSPKSFSHTTTRCNTLQQTAMHCNAFIALLKTRLQSRFASSSYAGGTMDFTRGNFKPKICKLDSASSILRIFVGCNAVMQVIS